MNMPVEPFGAHPRGALHDHLDDLADDVRAVDLRVRVRAASRRATVRRRAVIATAAAVAAVAVASGAWASRPSHHPVPIGSVPPSPALSPSPAASSAGPPVAGLPSSLYYLAQDGGLLRADGTELFSPSGPSCGLAVSPDRSSVAWTAVDGGGAVGDLIVARLDGTHRKTVLSGVSCTGGNAPTWLPGSHHLLLTQGNAAKRIALDVSTGKTGNTPLANVTGYVAWSPNGKYVAYAKSGKIVVARSDNAVVHSVAHGSESPTGGFSVQGVSDDGSRVVVGVLNSDPDQIRTGLQLVDTTTGKNVNLPGDVAPADRFRAAIQPAPGNAMVVRIEGTATHTLFLIGSDHTIHDTRTEPEALRTATLLP